MNDYNIRLNSTDSFSSKTLWMLRGNGLSGIKPLPSEIMKYEKEENVLPSESILLPDAILLASFSETMHHLYYVSPDNPCLVRARYVPNPFASSKIFEKEMKEQGELWEILEPDEIEAKILFIEPIYQLIAIGKNLIVVTSCVNNNEIIFTFHLCPLDVVKGFQLGHNPSEFSQSKLKIKNINLSQFFRAVEIGKAIIIYATNIENNGVYWGEFLPGSFLKMRYLVNKGRFFGADFPQKIIFEIVQFNIFKIILICYSEDKDVFFNINHMINREEISGGIDLGLSVSKFGKERVSIELYPKKNQFSLRGVKQFTVLKVEPALIPFFNTYHDEYDTFILVPALEEKRIWTYNIQLTNPSESGDFIPLLGGGMITEQKYESNMLKLSINRCDSIINIRDSIILFGEAGKPGWKVLLMPIMIFARRSPELFRKVIIERGRSFGRSYAFYTTT
ncbi:MAG: hypothetical protein HQL96_06220 [Magnetococcales bacterium]|nr:hypothetical protein [Magnetococcales bacterium]